MLGSREDRVWLKVPAPNEPVLVVVAVLLARVAEVVLYAKPRTVAFSPPVAVISPLNRMELEDTLVAAAVVTVGLSGVLKDKIEPVEVPLLFSA